MAFDGLDLGKDSNTDFFSRSECAVYMAFLMLRGVYGSVDSE
jgi:hypothetical protein